LRKQGGAKIAEKENMNTLQDYIAEINNLKEQRKIAWECEHIARKETAELKDKLSRRNMQIRELKKNYFSQEELRQLNYWWEGIYTGSKTLHDKVLSLLNNR